MIGRFGFGKNWGSDAPFEDRYTELPRGIPEECLTCPYGSEECAECPVKIGFSGG